MEAVTLPEGKWEGVQGGKSNQLMKCVLTYEAACSQLEGRMDQPLFSCCLHCPAAFKKSMIQQPVPQ